MAYPIYSFCCSSSYDNNNLALEVGHCMTGICLTAVDVLVFITCLVIGILGILSIIPMGTISYAFIGISASIFILWTIRIIQGCINIFKNSSF